MKRMSRFSEIGIAAACAATALAIAPGGAANASDPEDWHAKVVCDSASFYQRYDSAKGPYNKLRTLYRGNKIGHHHNHPVHNGWAWTIDFGPNEWGWMRIECIGAYNSW